MRKILLLLLLIPLLLAGLVVVAISQLDGEQLKPRIEALVADNSNLELRIAGELNWQWWPFGLQLGQTALALEGEPLATIEAFDLKVDLMAALGGAISIESIGGNGIALNLARDAQGRGNWERISLAGSDASTDAPAADTAAADSDSDNRTTLQLSLQTMQFSDITIDYRDAAQGADHLLQLAVSQLDASQVNLDGQPINIDADLGLTDSGGRAFNAQLQAALRYAANDGQFAVDRFAIEGKARLQKDVDALDYTASGSARIDAKQLLLEQLSADARFDSVVVNISASTSGTVLDGDITLSIDGLSKQMNRLGLSAIDTADPEALQSLALNSAFSYSDSNNNNSSDKGSSTLRLEDLTATLDKTRATGALTATLPKGDGVPAIDVQLAIDTIDLDRYLPADSNATASAQQASSDASGSDDDKGSDDEPLPLYLLHSANGKLQLDIDAVRFNGLDLQRLLLRGALRNGTLNMAPLSAQLYGGQLEVSGEVVAGKDSDTPSRIRIEQRLSQLQVAPLVQAMAIDMPVAGYIDVNANLAMRGNSIADWRSTLNGDSHFELFDGEYRELNIEHTVCRAVAKVRNEKLEALWPTTTTLGAVRGKINWNNGVGSIEQLRAAMNVMLLEGRGTFDIPGERIAIDMDAIITGDSGEFDPGCAINQRYRDIRWPLECKGTFDDNSCGLDNSRFDQLLGNIAREELRNKAQEKLEEKLGDKVGDGLKDLLKDGLDGLFR